MLVLVEAVAAGKAFKLLDPAGCGARWLRATVPQNTSRSCSPGASVRRRGGRHRADGRAGLRERPCRFMSEVDGRVPAAVVGDVGVPSH